MPFRSRGDPNDRGDPRVARPGATPKPDAKSDTDPRKDIQQRDNLVRRPTHVAKLAEDAPTGKESAEERARLAAIRRQEDRLRQRGAAEGSDAAQTSEPARARLIDRMASGRTPAAEAARRLVRPNRAKARRRDSQIKHPLLTELEEDEPDAPPQRGSISDEKAEILKRQLLYADRIRKAIAPDIPLDMPIDRDRAAVKNARQLLAKLIEQHFVPAGITTEDFETAVLDEVFGYGPIGRMVDDDTLTEIMVNGPYIVYIEVDGRLVESGIKFYNDKHVERIIRRIVLPLGRTVSREAPLIDARLPDGSRVNATVRPCAIDGPNLTIRKFSKKKLTVADLLSYGSLTEDMARFLEALVVARQNIIVSGGTGSGKTTLINCLSGYIPDDERVVTVEDACELQLKQRNVVRLETKKPTPQNPAAVTIRDCVVNALRMRPERIVVGECRSGEALDMLQAMNTGHDGSMTTVHANDPRACISRVETLCLMSGVDLPVLVVRRQLVTAINFIVQAARMRDGTRKITHITEVERLEGDVPILNDVFRYVLKHNRETGTLEGFHTATGTRPTCEHLLYEAGFEFPPEMYRPVGPLR